MTIASCGISTTEFVIMGLLPDVANDLGCHHPCGGMLLSGCALSVPSKVLAILDAAFWHLRADGVFYQFTYDPRFPVSRAILDPLGLKATRVGMTLANVPPAMVYRIRRRPPVSGGKKQCSGRGGSVAQFVTTEI